YIGGSGVASSSNTFAFVSNVNSGTRFYEKNILWNARSNASGTAANYALGLSALSGATTNYNDLFANGVGGCVATLAPGCALSDWQTFSGQDANSISVDSQYINPNGNAATGDLHIFPSSPCVGAGLTIAGITNDFDNDPRTNPPAIGADEPPVAPSPSPTPTATFTPTATATASFTPTPTATATPTATFTPTPTVPPDVSITKTADAASVSSGSQIGFSVTLTNSSETTATGLSVTDNLPPGADVNWTIDNGNTDPGWSVSGSPPNQSLVYSPTTLSGNTSTTAHVVSTTTNNSCGSYNNTASFSTDNDGSGEASASETV